MTGRRRCAVIGASGYIGQHFIRLLDDHPEFELVVLAAGDRSVSRSVEEVWQLTEPLPSEFARRRFEAISPARLERSGIELVFSGLPAGIAGPVESECARRGIAVFSNAADHRMDRAVPLLIPEVNSAHLRLLDLRPRGRAPIITNPNCTTTGLVLGLEPIWRLLRPRVVHVSTYQALSGAGFPGVESLTIADNVVPYISREEEKVAEESRRILGSIRSGRVRPASVNVMAHCARVGVREGHLEAVTLEAQARPAARALTDALRTFDPLAPDSLPSAPHPPVVLRNERDRPQPLRDRWAGSSGRSRGMAVSIGRIRWSPPYLRLFLLSHNAVRGGAGGSVLNAELAAARGCLD